MNGFDKLSNNARKAIILSFNIANNLQSSTLEIEHLFMGILEIHDGIASKVLQSSGFTTGVEKGIFTFPNEKKLTDEIVVSSGVKQVIKRAYTIAREYGHVYVGTEHILLSILKADDDSFIKELQNSGVTYEGMRNMILNYAHYPMGLISKPQKTEEKKNSVIKYLGYSLNESVRSGQIDPVIGREKEIDRVMHILSRRTKSNPILLGEAGVGKTAIVEGLAQKVVNQDVPVNLRNIEIWVLDVAHLVAGSDMRGDLEGKILALIEEAASNPNIVIFIDEIHTILNSSATTDIANIIKPALSKGKFKVIGATTYAEYQKYFENDAALSRRFQPIDVDEIGTNEAIQILEGLRSVWEDFHSVNITNQALENAVLLSDRYISERYLPDKAIDVIDEAAARKKMEKFNLDPELKDMFIELEDVKQKKEEAVNSNNFAAAVILRARENILKSNLKDAEKDLKKRKNDKKHVVDEFEVREVVANWTGIPVQTLSTVDIDHILKLPEYLSTGVIGQDLAIKSVANAIKRVKAGIVDENKPLASFLFLGPTGVGKSELAKQLAKYLFNDEDALVQIDMSEYMEGHSIAKLIGSPPGYVGYQEAGQFTEKIRRKPYSVILLDEIEKAHPDVLNVFLQILEDGHLTDGKGRRVNFKNTIIIMTSNIGAEDIGRDKILGFRPEVSHQNKKKETERAYGTIKDRMMSELKDYLRPEFINRIDDIVIFRSLDYEDVIKISLKFVNELNERLVNKGVHLELDSNALDIIVKKGFSEEMGARNVRRVIQDLLEVPIAEKLIENKMPKKKTTRMVNVKVNARGEIVFK